MSRPRCISAVSPPTLLFILLLFMPACSGDGPGDELTIQLPETEAGAALGGALSLAGSTERLVFLHTGADW